MHSYLEISRKALQHNVEQLRQHTHGKRKVIAVVKANAYGHGVKQVVPAVEDLIDAFAVDDINELTEIRTVTKKDVYVLGYVSHEEIKEALELKGILVVYDQKTLKRIQEEAAKLGIVAQVNLKIDALLGRQGVLIEDVPRMLDALSQCPQVKLRGMYAHFANLEDTHDLTHSRNQIAVFKQACEYANKQGFKGYERHISSTAGALTLDSEHDDFTHIRLGIGLYGYWPSLSVYECLREHVNLVPALRWVSCVAQVKSVPKGFLIGYGCTYQAQRDMRIAVVPQGYSDGYGRLFSNKSSVLIRGQRAPVCGRIAMNMFVVDVTDIVGVSLEDEVVLLGKQADAELTAGELAQQMQSIAYELVSNISPRLERKTVE